MSCLVQFRIAVAWTNLGPVAVDHVDDVRLRVRSPADAHRPRRRQVPADDRLRRAVSGVRIADADRVRLGAHLAAGTTVMHEGFSTSTPARSARRWSRAASRAGVIVGDGSDIGGGASIMGTLSGGGKDQVTIGERCLLGAEAGIGITARCCAEQMELVAAVGRDLRVVGRVREAGRTAGVDVAGAVDLDQRLRLVALRIGRDRGGEGEALRVAEGREASPPPLARPSWRSACRCSPGRRVVVAAREHLVGAGREVVRDDGLGVRRTVGASRPPVPSCRRGRCRRAR